MNRLSRSCIACLLLAGFAAISAAPASADEWTEFHITIDPASPSAGETFDLHAFSWFGDSGYVPLDQSIEVAGNEINVSALLQDWHSRPGYFFATVMTPGGAFFNDFGPLAAGTYQVNAEVWLTPWPATSGGYLYDQGSRQFTVTGLAQQALVGDFNGDGSVDALDYTVWRNSMGALGPSLPADADGDEDVDHEDYQMWRSHYGQGAAGGGSLSASQAPEPGTWLLAALAVAAAAAGCTSRRSNCGP
jgi:hypothetical protein